MKSAPPAQIRLDESYRLRLFRIGDAKAVALAVSESLEHLHPWMPWADDAASADERFQRRRLRGVQHKAATGEEWQYGLFPTDESRVLGSFGLMAKAPGTIEIGYWVHVDEIGHGLATLASRALTNASLALDGITTVYIRCDERNTRSASVPRRLGYTLEETLSRAPEAPGESGQLMIWARREPIS